MLTSWDTEALTSCDVIELPSVTTAVQSKLLQTFQRKNAHMSMYEEKQMQECRAWLLARQGGKSLAQAMGTTVNAVPEPELEKDIRSLD